MKSLNFEEIKAKILPYFVEIYGEEFRSVITERLNQILPIFYTTIEGQRNEMYQAQNNKRISLTLSLLEHQNIHISDETKQEVIRIGYTYPLEENQEAIQLLTACFNDSLYRETAFSNINQLNLIPLEDPNEIEKNLNILKKFGINITPEQYNTFLSTKQAIDIKNLQDYIKELNKKFTEFNQQFTELNNLIKKYEELEILLNQKYTLEFLKSIEVIINEKDKKLIEEYQKSERKDWWRLTYSASIFKLIGNNINEQGLLEAFSSTATAKLNDENNNEYEKQNIRSSRQKYFQMFNLKDDETNSPNPIAIDNILEKKQQYSSLAKHELIKLTSSYPDNIKQVEANNLISDYQFSPEIIEQGIICISPAVKNENGHPVIVPVLNFSKEKSIDNYADINFIHEINHAIELSLVEYQNNHFIGKTGFEQIDIDEEGPNRPYEQFSETINQTIAIEITEAMHRDNVFLFDEPTKSKTRNGTTYEQQRILTDYFYNRFKKEIFTARMNSNLNYLFDTVGEDNFNQLNEIINKYHQIPYYRMMDDIMANKKTLLTEKRDQLLERCQKINQAMEDYQKLSKKRK